MFHIAQNAHPVTAPTATIIEGIVSGTYLDDWVTATCPMFGMTANEYIAVVRAQPYPPRVYIEHPEDPNLLYLATMCRFLATGSVPRGGGGTITIDRPLEAYPGVTVELRRLSAALGEWAQARRGHKTAYSLNSHLKKKLGPLQGMNNAALAARCAETIEYALTPAKTRIDPDDPTKGTPLRTELNQVIAYAAANFPGATRGRIQSRLKAERGPVHEETMATLPDRIALVRTLWPC